MKLRYFLVCATFCHCTILAVCSNIEIGINEGRIIGKYSKTIEGKTFRSFTGIPYAEPPVGELRFKPPVHSKKWEGILNVTKEHNICPQMNVIVGDYEVRGDEDCLYLNVYAPEITTNNSAPNPVMFYIHGGAWMSGSANSDLYSPEMLLENDIVLVVTNYRLGALGFLSTGDSVLPGNNGLKDQNLALKWTKNNIKNFGGDPDRITVFGQSAGGASAHFHTLSPLSRDLISGAIIQSGSALSPWAITHKPLENAKRLANYLNCPTNSSIMIVECLRNVNSHVIVEQDKQFWEYSYDPIIPFKAVVEPDLEGAFITEEPANIIKSLKSAKVPIMTGVTTGDGAFKSAALYKDKKLIEELNVDFDRVAPFIFFYDQVGYNTTAVSKEIRNFYLGDSQIDNERKSELTNVCTDIWFNIGAEALIKMHTQYSNYPVYFYMFGYRGFATFTTIVKSDTDDFEYGACHCDELLYLLTHGTSKMKDQDKRIVDVMVALWTNFAKTGNPTPPDDNLLPVKWDPVSIQNYEHYFIGKNGNIEMNSNWEIERLKFVRKLKFNYGPNIFEDEL